MPEPLTVGRFLAMADGLLLDHPGGLPIERFVNRCVLTPHELPTDREEWEAIGPGTEFGPVREHWEREPPDVRPEPR